MLAAIPRARAAATIASAASIITLPASTGLLPEGSMYDNGFSDAYRYELVLHTLSLELNRCSRPSNHRCRMYVIPVSASYLHPCAPTYRYMKPPGMLSATESAFPHASWVTALHRMRIVWLCAWVRALVLSLESLWRDSGISVGAL